MRHVALKRTGSRAVASRNYIFSEQPPECPVIGSIVLLSNYFIYVHEGRSVKRET